MLKGKAKLAVDIVITNIRTYTTVEEDFVNEVDSIAVHYTYSGILSKFVSQKYS